MFACCKIKKGCQTSFKVLLIPFQESMFSFLCCSKVTKAFVDDMKGIVQYKLEFGVYYHKQLFPFLTVVA